MRVPRQNRRRRAVTALGSLRRIAAAAGVAALFAGAGVALLRFEDWAVEHPYFAVRRIAVDAHGKLPAGQVVEWAGLRPGMSIWKVDPAAVTAALRSHPRIRGAAVERLLPSEVRVWVEEREPVAVLLAREPAFVDRDGAIFPPLAGEALEGLPYVTGIRDQELRERPYRVREQLRAAAAAIHLWDAHPDWPAISELRPQGDDLLVLPVRTPLVVRLGGEAREDAFARLAAILDLWQGRESQLAAIDVSLPGQAIVRLRGSKKVPTVPLGAPARELRRAAARPSRKVTA